MFHVEHSQSGLFDGTQDGHPNSTLLIPGAIRKIRSAIAVGWGISLIILILLLISSPFGVQGKRD